MLGMNQREGRIFRVALICHIAFAFGLLVYGFIPSCEQKPEVIHVFELASTSPPPVPQVRPTPQNRWCKNLCPNRHRPSLSRLLKNQQTKKPSPKPPAPQKISIDQFRKQHDLPSPKPTPVNPFLNR